MGKGKRNRKRRAEKQRRRRSAPRSARPQASGGDLTATVLAAARARGSSDEEAALVLVDHLAAMAAGPGGAALGAEVDRLVAAAIASAWERGWQPADVHRLARYRLGDDEAELMVDAIATDARSYLDRAEASTAGRRWLAQLVELDAMPPEGGDPSPFARLGAPVSCGWADALWSAAGVLGLLLALPDAPQLLTPPSDWSREGKRSLAAADGIEPRVLARVRALLAKAESTRFEAEAEALSAKAQELMARHSVDRAVIDSARDHGPEPVGRRIGIEPPYVDAKALLLSEVASANHCRTVSSPSAYFSTVFGFDADVEATDLLYTSLLVQAGVAMRAAGPVRDSTGRSRTRSFRQSFLVGFAVRIGERLRKATDAVTGEAEAEHGASLVPVLAGRSARVDDVCRTAFPHMVQTSTRIGSELGFHAGTVAADQASITVHREVDEHAATA